jgi:DUF971 family protein
MQPPIQVRRLSGAIELHWSDNKIDKISADTLRRNCPCATCREARGETAHETPLTKPKGLRVITSTLAEELDLKKIWGVGNYALGIEWGDGHKTGIYTYQYLRELVEQQ